MNASKQGLLPLGEIIRPKPERPNLVENIQAALTRPERTVREYLFTPGLRGYFERIFQDLKEARGGGYWVQAEYGGGKTHFLSTLLCLMGAAGEDTPAAWAAVSDAALRAEWEPVVRQRRLLGANLTLMGTAAVIGSEQPKLVDLIDEAIVDALAQQGIADPGIRADRELLTWFEGLSAGIRNDLDDRVPGGGVGRRA